MNKKILLFLLMLLPLVASAQTKRTIHVATAGTLSDYISNEEKYQIEELTLTGELNGTDIRLIRDMAGTTCRSISDDPYVSYSGTDGKLKNLNLLNANIVKGGDSYIMVPEWEDPEYTFYGTCLEDCYTYLYTVNNSIYYKMFYLTKLETIVLPNSVTSIDKSAFWGCSNLTSIIVGSGNKRYDSRDNCNAIIEKSSNTLIAGCKNSTIPNSVTRIGDGAFYECSGLTSITIPNSVTSIGTSAFYNPSGLTSVNISDLSAWCGIDFSSFCFSTPYHLYLNGMEIKDLTIPDNITSIGNFAFYYCSGLTSVTIPNSVTSIGSSAFYYCSGLTSVTIPNSVTSIGSSAFSECSSLTSVTIPNSVTSIGGGSFSGCSGLTSVTISNSVKSIGNYAFWGCSGLTSVTIPNSVISIGNNAFSGCSGLSSVTIPNSVTSIGSFAFRNCSSLTSVTIPNSVTSIDYDAFSGCSGLTSVYISDLSAWCGIHFSGFCFSTPYHLYLNGEEIKDLDIPPNIISIGAFAFNNCSSVASVTIPNSVTSIESSAFRDCSSLTSVTIPNSVTSIGMAAFSNCSNLTSVTIPNSVTFIGMSAFSGCSGLASVTIPNSVTYIGYYVFDSCSDLTSITLPNSVTSIDGWAFGNCWALSDIYCWANNVPSTNDWAFDMTPCSSATLHVPARSIDAYKNTYPWSLFGIIVALTDDDLKPTDILSLKTNENINPVEIYTIDGKRKSQPQRGLNIIRLSNGSTKKVIK